MILRRFLVLGCSVLATSEAEAYRLAGLTNPNPPQATVLRMPLPAPRTPAAGPATLRSGFARAPSERRILVEVV